MKKLLLLLTLVSLPSYSAVSANVAFASDYIWRGMTQSDGPAMSGGFDYSSDGGFYAGIWGSNVNFNDGAGSELDYYFGYGFEMGGLGVDLGYVAFDYPKNTTGLDFEEIVKATVPKKIKIKIFKTFWNEFIFIISIRWNLLFIIIII